MKSVSALRAGIAILLCSIFYRGSFAGCKNLSAEDVGTRLGAVVSQIAVAFTRTDLWSEPDCRSPKTKALRDLCSLGDQVGKAVERVNKAIDRGCISENAAYSESPDAYAFRVLRSGMSTTDPKLRWQLLMRVFLLCDDPSLLTESGAEGCAAEVEEAALSTLQEDQELFNRHLALEILGSRLATEQSRQALTQVAQNGRSSGVLCPHGMRSESSTRENYLSWNAIARGFSESAYACEQQLAREALEHLDRRLSETGR